MQILKTHTLTGIVELLTSYNKALVYFLIVYDTIYFFLCTKGCAGKST
jgi:hypothetical protein